MSIGGISLYPFIIIRKDYLLAWNIVKKERILRHESIHIRQQEEMFVIPFYICYIVEWFIKLFKYGKDAYKNISFEREAHIHENDLDYLKNRKKYDWVKYL